MKIVYFQVYELYWNILLKKESYSYTFEYISPYSMNPSLCPGSLNVSFPPSLVYELLKGGLDINRQINHELPLTKLLLMPITIKLHTKITQLINKLARLTTHAWSCPFTGGLVVEYISYLWPINYIQTSQLESILFAFLWIVIANISNKKAKKRNEHNLSF